MRLLPLIFFHFHLFCTTGAGSWNLQQAADVKTQASLHVSCTRLHFRATNTPKVHGCITGLQKEAAQGHNTGHIKPQFASLQHYLNKIIGLRVWHCIGKHNIIVWFCKVKNLSYDIIFLNFFLLKPSFVASQANKNRFLFTSVA